MTELFVYGYATINEGVLSFNGNPVLELETLELETFLSKSYQHLEIVYPKFFKMDNLSKLGLLASELLVKNLPSIKETDPSKVALLLNNAHSSSDTDLKFQNTIQSASAYFPSPALFVYTLPNIVMGEICIRHGFKGENMCLVSEQFDTNQVYVQTAAWLATTWTEICLCGWFDVNDAKGNIALWAVGKEKKKSIADFNEENLGRWSGFSNIAK